MANTLLLRPHHYHKRPSNLKPYYWNRVGQTVEIVQLMSPPTSAFIESEVFYIITAHENVHSQDEATLKKDNKTISIHFPVVSSLFNGVYFIFNTQGSSLN